MKRKIICLFLVIACLTTLLASCKNEDPVCTGHVDADKNTACDLCGVPVITLVEKVPTEPTVVDMVVSAIPENATFVDFASLTPEKNIISTGETVTTDKYVTASTQNVENLYVIRYTEPVVKDEEAPENNTFRDVYRIFDANTGKDVLKTESNVYKEADEHLKTTVEAMPIGANPFNPYSDIFAFAVSVTTWAKDESTSNPDDYASKVTVTFYTSSGAQIGEAKEADDVDFDPDQINTRDGIAYIVLNEVKYAIDMETGAIVHSESVDTFIERPKFDNIIGNFGYIEETDEYENIVKVYVFDLTKWLECSYSYQVYQGYANYNVFYLANGNILVQGDKALAPDAVNYDVLIADSKFDIVYTLVDVAAKTATEVEFGYYILAVESPEEAGFNESIKNLVIVNAIKNHDIVNKEMYLLCDDALAIKADYESALPELTTEVDLIANNRFLVTIKYGEGSRVRKIYNEKGEVVATLSNSAVVRDGYILCDGKYYDFDFKLAYDPEADNKVVYTWTNNYILLKNAPVEEDADLSDNNDIYFYKLGMTAPALIVDAETKTADVVTKTQNLVNYYTENYFVVATTETVDVEGVPTVKTVYSLYNSENALVLTNESVVTSVEFVYNEDADYCVITLADGTIYFAR